MFAGPDFGPKGKIIYAAITYALMLLSYTVINVPYSAMLGVISPSPRTRVKSRPRVRRWARESRSEGVEVIPLDAGAPRGPRATGPDRSAGMGVRGGRDQRSDETVRRLRPCLRRAANTLRPPFVFMRERKPCVLFLWRLLGWYVRFMDGTSPSGT